MNQLRYATAQYGAALLVALVVLGLGWILDSRLGTNPPLITVGGIVAVVIALSMAGRRMRGIVDEARGAARRAEESERRLERIADSAPVALAEVDAEHRF